MSTNVKLCLQSALIMIEPLRPPSLRPPCLSVNSECGRGGGCYLLGKEPMLGLNSAAGSRKQPPNYSGIKDAASPVTSDGQGWCGLQGHKDRGSFQVVLPSGLASNPKVASEPRRALGMCLYTSQQAGRKERRVHLSLRTLPTPHIRLHPT